MLHAARGTRRGTLLGVACALVAAVLFSVNATFSKLALRHGLDSVELVSMRSAGAALLLFALAALARPQSLKVTWRELGFLAGYGILGIAMVQWLYFVAIDRMPVGIALLLEYTAPLMVALWVRFVRGEPVRSRVWAALALCLVGLAMVAQVWRGLTLDAVGMLAGIGAGAALATYYLMGERGMTQRDPVSLMAWIFFFSTLLWAIVHPWWTFPFDVLDDPVDLPGGLTGLTMPVGALVAWVVVCGTVMSFGLVLAGIALLGPARVGVLGMLEPVGSGLVAWWVLGEVLDGMQLAGAAVVLVGIVLAETARRRPADGPDVVPLPDGVLP